MAHSLSQIYLHIVFSTKNREPFLIDMGLRERLHGYMSGICKRLESPALVIGGVEDHVHLLCRLSRTGSAADLVHEVKRSSSIWVKQQPEALSAFYWQTGYGAFSISPTHVEIMKTYILGQEEHHRKTTYQDEIRRLCKINDVELDERHAWD